jgi:hypothetical protein
MGTPMNESRRASAPFGVGLFLVSAAVLALQVLLTRILSVQMWHHHSYMVVTMTLLGFAVAGALVTVRPSLLEGDPRRRLAWCGTLFAVSTILGYLLLSATAGKASDLTSGGHFFALGLFYSYLLIPYVFAGLVVVIILSVGRRLNRLYFVNLVGSALGAWLFILLVTPLGAERLLVLCAATGPLAALAFLRGPKLEGEPSNTPALGAAAAALVACVGLFAVAPTWLEVQVAPNKAEADILTRYPGARLLEVRWSPLCRLSLVELPDGPINIYQDGDAITVMHSDASWTNVPPVALNTIGYLPHQMAGKLADMEVLAIGIGGGIDLRYALDQGAKSVLGIEINGETVELVGEDYAGFDNDVYHREGATVEVGEGRSTLRRLDKKFDHIQLSGTDTYTAGNSGAYVLSESYLYTEEALGEYFDHLKPDGTLGFIRLAYDPPREMLRLVGIGLTELRERGIAEPSKHVVVITHEQPHPLEPGLTIRFSACVFSMEPFTDQVLDYYARSDVDWPEHRALYLPGRTEGSYAELAKAIDAGTEEEFYSNYYWDIRPVADDSPFFFNFHHWSALFSAGESTEWYELTGGPIGLKVLATLLVQTSVLVALLVFLPLLLLRRGGLRGRSSGRHLAYFLALGAGFMFLEISTAQRLVLFLGHPTYSLTVTLCSFLLFAGFGSLFSGRFEGREGHGLRWIVGLLAIVIVLVSLAFHFVLPVALAQPLWLRIVIVMAMLAPMNFLMGMPYPLGLGRLRRLEPRLVPLAQGVNGGASVIASILCIVIAMESGFQAVAYSAAVIYLVGMLLFTTGPLAPDREG